MYLSVVTKKRLFFRIWSKEISKLALNILVSSLDWLGDLVKDMILKAFLFSFKLKNNTSLQIAYANCWHMYFFVCC